MLRRTNAGKVGKPMLDFSPYAVIATVVACAVIAAAIWLIADRRISDPQPTLDIFAIAITNAVIVGLLIIVTVWVFPLHTRSVALVAVCVISGSAFAELKDTWKSGSQQFSVPRVLFRTAQWGTLAVAGYIVVQVLGNMD